MQCINLHNCKSVCLHVYRCIFRGPIPSTTHGIPTLCDYLYGLPDWRWFGTMTSDDRVFLFCLFYVCSVCFNYVHSWCFLWDFLFGLMPVVIILASFLIISCVCYVNSNLCNSSLKTCEHSSVVYSSFRNTLEWGIKCFVGKNMFSFSIHSHTCCRFFTLYVYTCHFSSGPFESVARGWLLWLAS